MVRSFDWALFPNISTGSITIRPTTLRGGGAAFTGVSFGFKMRDVDGLTVGLLELELLTFIFFTTFGFGVRHLFGFIFVGAISKLPVSTRLDLAS